MKPISQRKAIARYNKMLAERYETNKGKVRYFKCIYEQCDNDVVVDILDNGKEQKQLKCALCAHKMTWATDEIPEDKKATMEFYRPPLNYLLKKRKFANWIEWVLEGGLVLRPKDIPKEKNVLEIALARLQDLPFKKMPTNQEFFDTYTELLREDLGLKPEKSKLIKLK